MKKLLLLFLSLPFFCKAQTSLPSYPEILRHFFSNYSYLPGEAVDGLSFAKTKDGWYAQVIDRVTDVVKTDQLYWSVKEANYLALTGFEAPLASGKEKKIREYLLSFSFYGYERCLYYGYNHWAEDMIKDFGERPTNGYTDTLLEGLAKAYSAYASKFLWYQYGGQNEKNDSLKTKLKPLELPSKRRMDSVVHYIGKSIETYKLLAAKNNQYQMLVGNPGMKVFNEQMNAYMHTSMAGFDSLAQHFVQLVSPGKTISDIARNYLNACAPNAILFTFGDNDTYPLWYVQEKEGFRKDVAVVHAGLLGLPTYVDMLKRKGVVDFTSTPRVYGDSAFLYFLKEKNNDNKKLSIQAFIESIQEKKYTTSSEIYGQLAGYDCDQITMDVDLDKFKNIWNRQNLMPVLSIETGDYMFNDQFLVLDIIYTNLYKRPVYFTSRYELLASSLLKMGPVFQFLPLDPGKKALTGKISFEKTRTYLDSFYQLVPSEHSSAEVTATRIDEDVLSQYSLLASYYLKNNQLDKLALVMKKLLNLYHNKLPVVVNESNIPEMLLAAGYIGEGTKLAEDYSSFLYRLYQTPAAMYYLAPQSTFDLVKNLYNVLLLYGVSSQKIETIINGFAME